MNPKKIYNRLYDYFGPQGWWPIFDTTSNKCKYHTIGHLSEPELPSRRPTSDSQKFEICAGAILTQNTAWKNVEGALRNLKTFSHSQEYENVSPKFILSCKNLKHLIQPAGYYNQKAKKLRIFSEFWMNNDLSKIPLTALRLRLTALWGIGPETADSILL
ncbi:endonuclease III domain-containing protein, partial [Patescibacteria group bacterium]|nr:endonuclease III domain-containing protein [Patescibacteria group bacterium]